MKAVRYRSVRVLDTKEVKQAWSSGSGETIEASLRPVYDPGDVKSHSCQVNILSRLLHVSRRRLPGRLFRLGIILAENVLVALLYPRLLSGLTRVLPFGLPLPGSFGSAYAVSLGVQLLMAAMVGLPAHLEAGLEYRLKQDCFRKRGHQGVKFNEAEFDRRYKVVPEGEWPEFERRLKG